MNTYKSDAHMIMFFYPYFLCYKVVCVLTMHSAMNLVSKYRGWVHNSRLKDKAHGVVLESSPFDRTFVIVLFIDSLKLF